MILSLKKIVNSGSKIFCFRYNLKALSMEEKDADLWWDTFQNIV
jgi:hypothetical protein